MICAISYSDLANAAACAFMAGAVFAFVLTLMVVSAEDRRKP